MKTYIVNVQVEFTCVDPEMARDRRTVVVI